jgi:hypothetical protein
LSIRESPFAEGESESSSIVFQRGEYRAGLPWGESQEAGISSTGFQVFIEE